MFRLTSDSDSWVAHLLIAVLDCSLYAMQHCFQAFIFRRASRVLVRVRPVTVHGGGTAPHEQPSSVRKSTHTAPITAHLETKMWFWLTGAGLSLAHDTSRWPRLRTT